MYVDTLLDVYCMSNSEAVLANVSLGVCVRMGWQLRGEIQEYDISEFVFYCGRDSGLNGHLMIIE